MKKFVILGFIIFGMIGPLNAQPIVINEEEFSSINDKTGIQQAIEDFEAVINGKAPVHAIIDNNALLPMDGGTTYYLGQGYKLTILKSLADISGIHGYFYGPIITFDKNMTVGNTNQISYIRFFSTNEFNKLKSAP